MRVGSIFSGIGAPEMAWKGLGWDFRWCAEIDPFAAAVYRHHFPGVPNLGDVEKVDWSKVDDIDLLVFGSPCQSFSVAGNRLGLDDPRGVLTLLGIKVVSQIKPRYLLWENVPGVLSDDDGNTIQAVVELLAQLGYVCDLDIWDAQHFGVPQRRRRVFVTALRLDKLAQTKTPISERIMGDLLFQAMLATWSAMTAASISEYSKFPTGITTPVAAFKARMAGLDTLLGGSAVAALLQFWGEPESIHGLVGEVWADLWRRLLAAPDPDVPQRTAMYPAVQVSREEVSQFACLAVGIIQSVIDYGSLRQEWSNDHWSLALSSLTLIQDIVAYARSTGCELFCTGELRAGWRDNFNAARSCRDQLERRIGSWASAKEVLALSESLRGDTAARGKAREGIAPTIASRPTAGGGLGTDFDCDGGLVVGTLQTGKTPNGHGWAGINRQAVDAGHVVAVNDCDPIAFGGNNTTGPIQLATACRAKGGTGHGDFESETFIAQRVNERQVPYTEIDGIDGIDGNDFRNSGNPNTAAPLPLAAGKNGNTEIDGNDFGNSVKPDGNPELRNRAVAYGLRADASLPGEAITPSADAMGKVRLRDPGFNVYREVSPTIDGSHPHTVAFESRYVRNGRGAPSDIIAPLKAKNGNTGKGDGAPLVATAFRENQRGEVEYVEGDVVQSLSGGGGKPGQGYAAVAFGISSDATDRHGDGDGTAAGRSGLGIVPDATLAIRARSNNAVATVAYDITGNDPTVRTGAKKTDIHTVLRSNRPPGTSEGSTTTVVVPVSMSVRRLTPRECERLQGFPDNYTAIIYRRRQAADGPRYAALGNSMAVPVIRWLGERIELIDRKRRG